MWGRFGATVWPVKGPEKIVEFLFQVDFSFRLGIEWIFAFVFDLVLAWFGACR